jgi:hypothetical protein
MKKLLVLLVLFPLIGLSQLRIEEKTPDKELGEIKIAKQWQMTLTESKESYFYMFRNQKYTHIVDVQSFYLKSKEDINELYKLLIENLQEADKKEIRIEISKQQTLILDFNNHKVRFMLWDGYTLSYSSWFNERQINDLYGVTSK